jgi:hypothetical protein
MTRDATITGGVVATDPDLSLSEIDLELTQGDMDLSLSASSSAIDVEVDQSDVSVTSTSGLEIDVELESGVEVYGLSSTGVVNLELETDEIVIEIPQEGLQGVPGPASVVPGPVGPPGPQGTPGSAPQAYVYEQAVPSATWVVTHNLGYRPNATVVDSAGTTVEGQITYDSSTQITLNFTSSFSGFAYLS